MTMELFQMMSKMHLFNPPDAATVSMLRFWSDDAYNTCRSAEDPFCLAFESAYNNNLVDALTPGKHLRVDESRALNGTA